MKLLIIEDEKELSSSICHYLGAAGFVCETSFDFNSALEKITVYEYGCIILDLNLPGGSGLELLRELKANKKSDGVLIISARNAVEDRVKGLQTGADDYLSKPFHMAELGARVDAIIRRKSFQGNDLLTVGQLQINTQEKTVRAESGLLSFTRMEYDLLLYFCANKNRVISKEAIAEHLWGDNMDLVDNYDLLYTHIKNLRKKLQQAGCSDMIKSIYGLGYKLQAST